MTLEEARELVNGPVWPSVMADFIATGAFAVHAKDDPARLNYLDAETRRQLDLWLDALEHAEEWKTVVSGEKVRELKRAYPGVYPEVLRYTAYFTRFRKAPNRFEEAKLVLKLKFPSAYGRCFA